MGIQVISFNCVLKNSTGQFISSTYNREVLALENKGAVLNGLARELQDVVAGQKKQIKLKAESAYGFYDPSKVILFPRNKLPNALKEGQIIQIAGKSGMIRTYKVIQLHQNMVSLDGNHPLAGQDLVFEIEVLSAREALPEEVQEADNVVSQQLLH
ncbi:FKBP-type peptidyl-prolyl cis-trans isomerase [bacterium]|nr:FKBP-type peptidyl-prolyl cis-trans isomerase [bacterium]